MTCDVPQVNASMIRAASDLQKEAWFVCEFFIVSLRVLATEPQSHLRHRDGKTDSEGWGDSSRFFYPFLFLSIHCDCGGSVAVFLYVTRTGRQHKPSDRRRPGRRPSRRCRNT